MLVPQPSGTVSKKGPVARTSVRISSVRRHQIRTDVRATGARTPFFAVFGCARGHMRDCYDKQEVAVPRAGRVVRRTYRDPARPIDRSLGCGRSLPCADAVRAFRASVAQGKIPRAEESSRTCATSRPARSRRAISATHRECIVYGPPAWPQSGKPLFCPAKYLTREGGAEDGSPSRRRTLLL